MCMGFQARIRQGETRCRTICHGIDRDPKHSVAVRVVMFQLCFQRFILPGPSSREPRFQMHYSLVYINAADNPACREHQPLRFTPGGIRPLSAFANAPMSSLVGLAMQRFLAKSGDSESSLISWSRMRCACWYCKYPHCNRSISSLIVICHFSLARCTILVESDRYGRLIVVFGSPCLALGSSLLLQPRPFTTGLSHSDMPRDVPSQESRPAVAAALPAASLSLANT